MPRGRSRTKLSVTAFESRGRPRKPRSRSRSPSRRRKPGLTRADMSIPRWQLSSRATLPEAVKVQLVYSDYLTVGAGTAIAGRTYRLQSVYDPQYAVGGGSASLFTTFNQLYQSYCVVKCKVTAQFISTDGTNTGYVFLYQNDDATILPLTTPSMLVQPQSNLVAKAVLGTSGLESSNRTLTYTYDPCKQFDLSERQMLSNDDYNTKVTTDPADNTPSSAYITPCMGSFIGGGVGLGNVAMRVQLYYTVIFNDPKLI